MLLLSIGFICGWFCLTTLHFFSQISSLDNVPLKAMSAGFGLRKANLFHNKVSQVQLIEEEAMKAEEKIPFPQSIKNEDWDTIVHPSVAMLPKSAEVDKEEKNHLMKVPKFWNPSSIGSDVRIFLGNYGERLITKAEAARIGSFTPSSKDYDVKDGDVDLEVDFDKKGGIANIHYLVSEVPPKEVEMLETIYITIASYRDYRCPHTVEALFDQATHPERLRVGIVDQLNPDEDDYCGKPKRSCADHPDDTFCKYSNQIDVYEMDAKLAVGPVFARHIGDRMYRGEYFVMQSDAHMEFLKGWDADVISQWKSANNEMAVLTTYVSNVDDHYNKEHGTRETLSRPYMCVTVFEEDYYNSELSFLMHDQQPEEEPAIKGEPSLSPFWAAGFSFSRGHFAVQVPYDQYQPMIFQGEEISIGVRGFTFGYDFYAPEKSVLYHYYHTDPKSKKKVEVKRFWENADAYEGVEKESKARLLGIIEMLGAPVSEEDGEEKVVDGTKEGNEDGEGAEAENNEGEAEKNEDGEGAEAEKNEAELEENEEIVEVEWNAIDAEKYNIGQVRSVQKFLDTFGIDLAKRTVEGNMCEFINAPMTKIFKEHIREDGMGVDYSKIDYRFQDPEEHGKTWEKYL